MLTSDEALQRFRRRTDTTDPVTLQRNLTAGVYGPPGSASHAVAERALAERFGDAARALQLPSRTDAEAIAARAEVARRAAVRATWLAVIALVLAVLGLAAVLRVR